MGVDNAAAISIAPHEYPLASPSPAACSEDIDHYWMARALVLASRAAEVGEVPVGALVVADGLIIGEGYNRPISDCDPSAHAEMIALRAAARQQGNYRLTNATLYATLEPCAMCAGALIQARVSRVVFGAGDSRNGACGSVFDVVKNPLLNHQIAVNGGVLAANCAELLRNFFRARR